MPPEDRSRVAFLKAESSRIQPTEPLVPLPGDLHGKVIELFPAAAVLVVPAAAVLVVPAVGVV